MKEEGQLIVLCPFCRKEWTAKMKEMLHFVSDGYDSGGGETADVTIEIVCDGCDKVVYKKECTIGDRWW